MLKPVFVLAVLCISTIANAQYYNEEVVDNRMRQIPTYKTHTTKDIAEYIKQNFYSEKDKARAIHYWVVNNIAYSSDSANIINLGTLQPHEKIAAALRRRKGVCENFAAIFNDLCLNAGIKSFIVDGYTKQHGSIDKTGHAWCAVFINDEWLLCDPTWDAGFAYTKHFLVEPSAMIQTHMPFDHMWQLLEKPVTHKQFYNGDVYVNKNNSVFNYKDSIAAYFTLDSLQKLRSTVYRVQLGGLYNKMVKERALWLRMHIENIRQDEDADTYNASIADLKRAGKIYNDFIDYRNSKFIPNISDNSLKDILSPATAKISEAYIKLDAISRSQAVLKFSVDEVKDKLDQLAIQIKEQKEFLNLYLNTSTANRKSLFYKQVTKTAN